MKDEFARFVELLPNLALPGYDMWLCEAILALTASIIPWVVNSLNVSVILAFSSFLRAFLLRVVVCFWGISSPKFLPLVLLSFLSADGPSQTFLFLFLVLLLTSTSEPTSRNSLQFISILTSNLELYITMPTLRARVM